ncbi:flap endonuclease-1 [Candidatus Woesearchaeota archaeon]|nr:flap endonuclease-1 [Candidatus Woesearchaeota archaeon]
MGTKLSPILTSHELSFDNLNNKKLVIDSYNIIYQYISSIRQRDGTPLMDSKGNITSHLSGLFFRTTRLIEIGSKLAFCFDGRSPELKKKEQQRRKELKKEAMREYQLAVERQDLALMRKYASRTSRLTLEMIEESKELINALGLPIIQAPSEAEAQAAYMVNKGDFYGLISQDTDGLIFGTSKLIKNLTISQRKKIKDSLSYERVPPEEIDLAENLNNLGIDQEQLIVLSMLVGTDFNIGGIKGIGPKKGLKLIKEFGKDFDSLFREVKWGEFFDNSWKEVYELIKNMPVTDDYSLEWKNIDNKKIIHMLVKKHDFSQERVENALEKLVKKQAQKGLGEWF